MRSVLTESPTYETYNPITHYSVRERFSRVRTNSVSRAEGAHHLEPRDGYDDRCFEPGYSNNDLRSAERGRNETNDGDGEAQ